MIFRLRRWTQRGESPKSSNLMEVAATRCERPRVGPHTPAAEASFPFQKAYAPAHADPNAADGGPKPAYEMQMGILTTKGHLPSP